MEVLTQILQPLIAIAGTLLSILGAVYVFRSKAIKESLSNYEKLAESYKDMAEQKEVQHNNDLQRIRELEDSVIGLNQRLEIVEKLPLKSINTNLEMLQENQIRILEITVALAKDLKAPSVRVIEEKKKQAIKQARKKHKPVIQ